ncbi:MAG: ATP-binding cassette domain-containing protein [Calditrichaeota bacterium]|nr:MAG: ATP-binding cassette domain-containing protein [Calditrichota bacterium]
MSEPLIELQHVFFRYEGVGASPQPALSDISLQLGGIECTAIVGPSGSGKTTLIQHFTGLLRPTAGQVFFRGQDIWNRHFKQQMVRRAIGLVFQFPEAQLFEETVEKDIAFGPKNAMLPVEEIRQRVQAAMNAVDLAPELFLERSPFRLSEGEKRRVAIAGVLAMQPKLLVFDEPTAGLDPRGVRRFVSIIRRLQAEGQGVVVITHNMDFVAEVADRVVVMNKGAILFDGMPQELFNNTALINQADLERPALYAALAEMAPKLPFEVSDVLNIQQLEERFKMYLRNCVN